ncbi:MAG: hypothetical protein K6G88_11690 [Lachnospiraceae bacterium]|nr:hypothetical protein [Lachnospiraceae bacterium]
MSIVKIEEHLFKVGDTVKREYRVFRTAFVYDTKMKLDKIEKAIPRRKIFHY